MGLLSVFTIAETLLVGVIASTYSGKTVSIAIGVTLSIVFVLGLFAFQTSYDFTGAGPYLVAFLWTAILYSFIIGMFGALPGTGYAVAMVLLFSAYVIHDVQLIVGGKHRKYQLSIDDYCFAALVLYLDIINLFLYILQLFGD